MERSNSMTSKRPGLYEFLIEAELQQYYAGIKNDLKVQNVSQLKYVTDEDLHSIGMAKPEIRRLKKFFQKHFPQNYLSKIKKMILPKKEEEWESMVGMLPEEGTLDGKPPIKVPNKHIIPADNILVNKELGTGEFGVVQQGVWTNDGERIQVAIKCLSRERMQNNPIEFLKEAAIMHGIDDEHIVRLYGVVLDTNALMLVTELAPLRSLLECLKEPSLRASFPVISLCNFAVQICSGMQYLEMKRLIHRDLAARNILVFSKNKVKISDFGLSRALGVGKDYYQTNFNVNLKLPIAWCAPECISYLRFTSASDVWAFGVTLWEMFSYGFQPWAALTGHQILEAIDEPNLQRLEQPECCPKEYYSVMLKCWQHDPNKRPRFVDLMNILPDCKPEQVQAVQDSIDDKMKRDQLSYRQGDVITVLDKGLTGSGSNSWKGVLNNGKSGFFNPAHTVTYLGANLPSNKGGEFMRGDGKNTYSSRRSRLRPDMISCPQGDVKHTSHIGLDGAYFGDISFLGGSTKYNHIPHQVVMPYKHEDNTAESDTSSIKTTSDRAPLLTTDPRKIPANDSKWLDCENVKNVCAGAINSKCLTDHEYHEISDEECVAESPRFEKTFDFGPSLLDEMNAMFRNIGTNDIGSPPPSPLDVDTNKRNELREIAASLTKSKKKQATVKPISAADEKALDSAIALANEIAACSMNDLDNGTSQHGPDSPRTPASPNKRKFSFRFPTPLVSGALSKHSQRTEGHTFTDEAASIPDIQSLCSSLKSPSSFTSLESLKNSAPFKLPLWDRASADFCFARSHDLLTRRPPTLLLDEVKNEEIYYADSASSVCSSVDIIDLASSAHSRDDNTALTFASFGKYAENGAHPCDQMQKNQEQEFMQMNYDKLLCAESLNSIYDVKISVKPGMKDCDDDSLPSVEDVHALSTSKMEFVSTETLVNLSSNNLSISYSALSVDDKTLSAESLLSSSSDSSSYSNLTLTTDCETRANAEIPAQLFSDTSSLCDNADSEHSDRSKRDKSNILKFFRQNSAKLLKYKNRVKFSNLSISSPNSPCLMPSNTEKSNSMPVQFSNEFKTFLEQEPTDDSTSSESEYETACGNSNSFSSFNRFHSIASVNDSAAWNSSSSSSSSSTLSLSKELSNYSCNSDLLVKELSIHCKTNHLP
ncbi:unnamed protein product [Bemisia tabaci]|uniref:non-specific protein-tyrosine kinase n=1 Tax=Bemisia tabaci TaxID=7038 RepID=A0A9P0EVV3_BEMTA|nr:unnamed protein product [Bemisia tabaci]